MATGIAHRLYSAGFKRIVMSDIPKPVAVRRSVAFCEVVYEGTATVEGISAELIVELSQAERVWARGSIPVLVDDEALFVSVLKPDILVDAVMMKREKGSMKGMAPLVIGVGPGFKAPDTVDVVIESNRGHDMGRVIYRGEAEPFTGTPGVTAGYTNERVLRSPHGGAVRTVRSLGEEVKKDDIILYIDGTPITARIDGVLRGLIRPIKVPEDEKVGDIDPRGKKGYCFTISDKARAIGGGVLEAVMHRFNT